MSTGSGPRPARFDWRPRLRSSLSPFLEIALILFGHSLAWAQYLPFRTLSIDDGLLQSTVYDMYQDQQGYLWLATIAGVSRFDGLDFHNYTNHDGLPHYLTRSILQTPDGRIWVATDGGLASFNGDAFESLGHIDPRLDLPVRALYPSGPGFFIGTLGAGLCLWNGHALTCFDAPEEMKFRQVGAITSDGRDGLWLSTERGIAHFDGIRITPFPAADRLPARNVRTLYRDSRGRLWIGTHRNGALIWDGSELRVPGPVATDDAGSQPEESVENPLAGEAVNRFFESENGDMWVATRESGAFRFDAEERLVKQYTSAVGLGSNSVYSFLRDHEGGLWFGTFGGGVSRLPGEDLLRYAKQTGLPDPNVYAITQDGEGTIWIGSNGAGLSRMEGDRLVQFERNDELAHPKVMCAMSASDGSLWVGTLGGLSVFDGQAFRHYKRGRDLPHNTVYDLAEDDGGRVWIGTRRGLVKYENGMFTRPRGPNSWKAAQINTLWIDQDGVWLGSAEGLARVSRNVIQPIQRPTDAELFVQDLVRDGDGVLWLATSDGLYRYDHHGFERFGAKEGLSSSMCKAVTIDRRGHLWVGTLRGLYRYDYRTFSVFTSRDGVASNEINRGGAFRDKTGNLWFGTVHGVTKVRHDANFTPNTTPPPIHIRGLVVNGVPQRPKDVYSLPHDRNDLAISFKAITFSAPEELKYSYRLKGGEAVWRQGTTDNVLFPALSPGRYTFEVRACNSDGVCSESPARLSFQIHPPFWAEVWFRALLLAVVLAFGYLVFQDRMRKERMRTNAAAATATAEAKSRFLAAMSHELRTPLNAILGYSELLAEEAEDNDHQQYQDDLDKINYAARQLLQLVDNLLDLSKLEAEKTSMHWESFAVEEFVLKLTGLVQPLVAKGGNVFRTNLDGSPTLIYADRTKLRQILLNLISNAAKFTENGTITLRVTIDAAKNGDPHTLWQVEDTGIGMDPTQLQHLFQAYTQVHTADVAKYGGTGLGLMLCRRFCTMMGGDLTVSSEVGVGTTFSVVLPDRQKPA
ncbi:Histidine kinase domain-containing protein [Sulfidibacter corallicola]|uniref:histidine kinase n=1 Tax=Sulfidibacter corallicola TaxID=2818388 RepID=A0A8A4TIA2_SULCO|nr:sensor histidine kinase [Sulfidibacter corallicola]QTD49280.1 hypothetical protein J3U87_27150 [Sulfidibacter corallicola]